MPVVRQAGGDDSVTRAVYIRVTAEPANQQSAAAVYYFCLGNFAVDCWQCLGGSVFMYSYATNKTEYFVLALTRLTILIRTQENRHIMEATTDN